MISGAKDSLFVSLNPKVEQLAGEIATDETDLKAAGKIPAKEASSKRSL